MQQAIILTGPMGSGKTSVGRLLSAKLGYRFLDLDALIVKQAGKSINQIFADEGEAAFRDRETAALASLKGEDELILSTGGGAVLREENRPCCMLPGWWSICVPAQLSLPAGWHGRQTGLCCRGMSRWRSGLSGSRRSVSPFMPMPTLELTPPVKHWKMLPLKSLYSTPKGAAGYRENRYHRA